VVAAVDNRWAARAYSGVVPEVRKSKLGVLLAPEVELDGDLVGVRLRTPLERLGPPGRGYLVQHGVTELVQVAQFDDDGANDREGPSAPVGALGT
jgi:S-DNA-T family DNA segregation ATPase FtsK/SpoIIIE